MNFYVPVMNLTKESALSLFEDRKFISFRFNIFDNANQQFYHVRVSADEAKSFSHQFVAVSEIDIYSMGNKNYRYSAAYTQYKITGPNGKELYVYMKRSSSEVKRFVDFQFLIASYPGNYAYYIGDLTEGSKYVDMVTFVDMNAFAKMYQTTGFLNKTLIDIIRKYALNQYKTYKLRDCSDEKEYAQLSPNFLLKPFDYQLQTMTWMSRIENKDYKFLVPKSSFYKLTDGAYIELLKESSDNFMSQYVFESDYETTEMIRCRGGLLCDIPGNGKTVTTIAHIYHNQPLLMPLLTSIVEREVYIASRATLVVCPTNIAAQWYDEILHCLGKTAGGMRVIKITTRVQMKQYSLADLASADVIITTYTWLTHNNHIGTGFIKKGKSSELLASQKKQKIMYGDKYENYTDFTLLFLKYNRIIFDEFHEEIDSNSAQSNMIYIIKNCLKAKYIWGISGTPLLDNDKIIENMANLLQIRDSHNEIYNLDVVSQHEVFDRFVRRNAKQYLTPINYRTVISKQTVEEKQLYDSSLSQDIETLMKLCCYHNIGGMDIQNIDDVAKIQNDARLKQKSNLKEQIVDIEVNLKQIETVLRTMNPTIKDISELYYLIDSKHPKHTHKLVLQIQQTPTLQLQVDSLRQYHKYVKLLEEKKDELVKLEQCMSYYNQTMKNTLNDGKFVCPITGETVGDGEVVITKDGHLFSKNAIETLFECGDGKFITCPVTDKKLSRADITIVTNKAIKKGDEKSSSNERLFGTKITKIISEIKALPTNEKVIVFGQWDSLLNTIGYAFAANNIEHVYIKGNVGARDKAINDFRKDPKIRAILLSSVYGASGVNLTEATHVYIVHPFYGEDGHQYEKQAIARAHRTGQKKNVTVSFFITEKTIEQDLWEKNRKHYYTAK